MSKLKSTLVGIIAEDKSDVESIKILIHRITENYSIGIRKFVGKGCSKIPRKVKPWSNLLKQKGCNYLIIIHDLDLNDLAILKKCILDAINPCPISKYLICIPIQELEAWFLSDPEALQKSFNLKRLPNIKGNTYEIKSPKEYLEKIIHISSDGEKIYLNTTHNAKLSQEISIEKTKNKNPSFIPLYNFIIDNLKT